ncbi:MAG: hypothetical protein US89_C0011G0001 [Candidatus Peregrinibacteria bacterium GW2011_GWF2_38_29]|nr:MAG: hypothetical protein US89_C0011G0001 [Candidatus Peregrinibacteria bacterium GW2011_GWF2_38_29]HBB02336.1 hypothetical protein [Candidatus Peregrinibacteria bacterium]
MGVDDDLHSNDPLLNDTVAREAFNEFDEPDLSGYGFDSLPSLHDAAKFVDYQEPITVPVRDKEAYLLKSPLITPDHLERMNYQYDYLGRDIENGKISIPPMIVNGKPVAVYSYDESRPADKILYCNLGDMIDAICEILEDDGCSGPIQIEIPALTAQAIYCFFNPDGSRRIDDFFEKAFFGQIPTMIREQIGLFVSFKFEDGLEIVRARRLPIPNYKLTIAVADSLPKYTIPGIDGVDYNDGDVPGPGSLPN